MGEAGWELSSLAGDLASICVSFRPDIFIGHQVHKLIWRPLGFRDVGLRARDAETLMASGKDGFHSGRPAKDSPHPCHQPFLLWDWFRNEGHCRRELVRRPSLLPLLIRTQRPRVGTQLGVLKHVSF